MFDLGNRPFSRASAATSGGRNAFIEAALTGFQAVFERLLKRLRRNAGLRGEAVFTRKPNVNSMTATSRPILAYSHVTRGFFRINEDNPACPRLSQTLRQHTTIDAKPGKDADEADLFAAFAGLRGADEAARFLRDLTTPAELAAFAERWRIARLLDEGALSYREIAAATGASTTTVGRVARFLREEPHQGYRIMLDRLEAE